MTAIRKHIMDFAAIIALILVSLLVGSVHPLQPAADAAGLGAGDRQDFYEFKGEFQTGQAVTPGQGQTVNIAGVKVGEITERRARRTAAR